MAHLTFAGLCLVTIVCIAVLIFWLRQTLHKIEEPLHRRKKIVLGALLALVIWLGFTAVLAKTGFLSVWDARPPRLPIVPLTAFIILILIHRIPYFKRLIDATPRYWAVGFQTFRIGVELAFWGLFSAGLAPAVVTFEGRNFDVIVGLTAPFVAFGIWKSNLHPRFVVIWNLLGLGILLNTIFTLLTAMPGPLHREWPGIPFTSFADWPFVWIPAFLAPLAIFLHVFSIRQNLSAMKENK